MPQEAITDVLPVHTSDTATFKKCRRRWDWTSPMRYNLKPKVSVVGINFNLAFGTAIHSALESYYVNKENPATKFLAEWDELAENVISVNEGWMTENREAFDKHRDLGNGMMTYYEEWAQTHDNFEVVSTEHLFSVDTGLRAHNIDTGVYKPVHYRGRMDMVVRDLDTGRYGIVDHKTSSQNQDGGEEYVVKLDMDEQVTRYVWAAQLEAEQYDLPYKKIDFVYYNILWKGYPGEVQLTSRGVPSINRSTQFCTYKTFSETILADHALIEWFKGSVKAQEFAEWLKEQGSTRYIQREVVYRNQHEVFHCGERVKMEIQDMLAPDLRIYPNATADWYCLKCPFRGPCLAAMDGSDVGFMLDAGYESNMNKDGQYTTVTLGS